jgi:hypothetical protein
MATSDSATTLKTFLAGRTTLDIEPNVLLGKLREVASTNGLNVNLPLNARGLSCTLQRATPAMRELWGIDLRRIRLHGRRLFRIRPWQPPKNAANGQVVATDNSEEEREESERGEVRLTIILRPSKCGPCVIVDY